MDNCIFCNIQKGELNAIYQDDKCFAINDISPAAPMHVLVIPKEHYQSIEQTPSELILHLMDVAKKIIASNELAKGGHRIVINTGENGGQSVPHLHIHIIAGRQLSWPPG